MKLCRATAPAATHAIDVTVENFQKLAQVVIDRGYKALKFDPFGAGYYEAERAEKLKTISLVEAVRDAVGPDVELLIEMHGRFNPVTAVEMTRALAPFQPSWVEEPVPPANLPALKKVADAVAPDGVIEGIEAPAYRFCLGVQWHPEFHISEGDRRIFRAFIAACGG